MTKFAVSLCFVAALAISGAAVAQTADNATTPAAAQSMSLELNSAAQTDAGSCRLTLVARNGSAVATAATAWQVAVFDAQGIVRSILALDFGALPIGKTKIAVFDLPGRRCDDISRIVVNDVAKCETTDGGNDPSACLNGLSASTRTSIDFGL
ncbi:hypothetical protein [Paracoccus pacificus]|uniref:Tat pathway signal protein n=1 Tax=Paracoccus pacificus TaxID=1463598 RepID=A0ABW4R724_9RHOB